MRSLRFSLGNEVELCGVKVAGVKLGPCSPISKPVRVFCNKSIQAAEGRVGLLNASHCILFDAFPGIHIATQQPIGTVIPSELSLLVPMEELLPYIHDRNTARAKNSPMPDKIPTLHDVAERYTKCSNDGETDFVLEQHSPHMVISVSKKVMDELILQVGERRTLVNPKTFYFYNITDPAPHRAEKKKKKEIERGTREFPDEETESSVPACPDHKFGLPPVFELYDGNRVRMTRLLYLNGENEFQTTAVFIDPANDTDETAAGFVKGADYTVLANQTEVLRGMAKNVRNGNVPMLQKKQVAHASHHYMRNFGARAPKIVATVRRCPKGSKKSSAKGCHPQSLNIGLNPIITAASDRSDAPMDPTTCSEKVFAGDPLGEGNFADQDHIQQSVVRVWHPLLGSVVAVRFRITVQGEKGDTVELGLAPDNPYWSVSLVRCKLSRTIRPPLHSDISDITNVTFARNVAQWFNGTFALSSDVYADTERGVTMRGLLAWLLVRGPATTNGFFSIQKRFQTKAARVLKIIDENKVECEDGVVRTELCLVVSISGKAPPFPKNGAVQFWRSDHSKGFCAELHGMTEGGLYTFKVCRQTTNFKIIDEFVDESKTPSGVVAADVVMSVESKSSQKKFGEHQSTPVTVTGYFCPVQPRVYNVVPGQTLSEFFLTFPPNAGYVKEIESTMLPVCYGGANVGIGVSAGNSNATSGPCIAKQVCHHLRINPHDHCKQLGGEVSGTARNPWIESDYMDVKSPSLCWGWAFGNSMYAEKGATCRKNALLQGYNKIAETAETAETGETGKTAVDRNAGVCGTDRQFKVHCRLTALVDMLGMVRGCASTPRTPTSNIVSMNGAKPFPLDQRENFFKHLVPFGGKKTPSCSGPVPSIVREKIESVAQCGGGKCILTFENGRTKKVSNKQVRSGFAGFAYTPKVGPPRAVSYALRALTGLPPTFSKEDFQLAVRNAGVDLGNLLPFTTVGTTVVLLKSGKDESVFTLQLLDKETYSPPGTHCAYFDYEGGTWVLDQRAKDSNLRVLEADKRGTLGERVAVAFPPTLGEKWRNSSYLTLIRPDNARWDFLVKKERPFKNKQGTQKRVLADCKDWQNVGKKGSPQKRARTESSKSI